ncbi:MAG: aminobutyraldehyde dehydrogenase, partial [Microbacteriaceae bacterium]|nr:aminobutyraldehyde dehydrogenase [Microbacteriaceae bacterium]
MTETTTNVAELQWQRPLNLIDGELVDGEGERRVIVRDPALDEVIVDQAEASAAQVDAAVAAARRAFGTWSRMTPGERSDLMHAWVRDLAERAEEIAAWESRQCGKPMKLTTQFDVAGSIDNVAFYAGAARNFEGKSQGEYSGDHTSSIRREPIGVVGSIAPWNYPLQMAAWKILPAVAAGNTIVIKPAEITPITTVLFAESALRAGIPAGVINVVTGGGRSVGTALTGHDDVDMVSFTGSTEVGRSIAANVAGKRVHLELGGKAPFVVFDDADLEAAAQGAVAASCINTGQDCTAATRAYVHSSRIDEFVERVAALMDTVVLGEPNDPATDLGPLSSRGHQEKVAAMVDRARDAGAAVVRGGAVPERAGYFYEPTLITGAAQDSEIVQDEVFGPVLVVLPFDTDDEAIELANDTPYGLAASAWTRDVFRAGRATREIQAGCVWINDHIP